MQILILPCGLVLGFRALQTPQREHWDGHPIELGDAWILCKGDKVARCILVTHPLGWELRLMTTDLLRSQVCRSAEEILATHEQWKTALVSKGWRTSSDA